MEARIAFQEEQTVESRIQGYRTAIGEAIDGHRESQGPVIAGVVHEFGEAAGHIREEFLDLLDRGGNRARGLLVMAGYEMFGGSDLDMAAQAALAIELVQASLLAHDDIQDNSPLRRGAPSLFVVVGPEAATNAALQAREQAGGILLRLKGVPAETKVTVGTLISDTLINTADGQNVDHKLKATDSPPLEIVYAVMKAKTARYTVLNPLQVGMILGGATLEQAAEIEEFALNIGIAYQLRNDLKIMEVNQWGDILGNKPTALMHYALSHAEQDDKEFLETRLKSQRISDEQFARCQQILRRTGAVNWMHEEIEQNNVAAKEALPKYWPKERIEFLLQIIGHIAKTQK